MLFKGWHHIVSSLIEILCIREVSGYAIPPYHGPYGSTKPGTVARAVYFMTNTASNSIVALSVAADGTIATIGSVTPTGGSGGNLVDPMKLTPNGPDALGSQGSIQVVENVSGFVLENACH